MNSLVRNSKHSLIMSKSILTNMLFPNTIKVLINFSILISLLISCSRDPNPIPSDKLAYVGTWRFYNKKRIGNNLVAEKFLLKISKNGYLSYLHSKKTTTGREISSYSCSCFWEYPIKVISNEQIEYFFLYFFSKNFEIQKAPHKVDNKMIMIVNNHKLRKLSPKKKLSAQEWECEDIDMDEL